MSDRTTVVLQVLTVHLKQVKTIIKGESDIDREDKFTYIWFDEVNFGELPFLKSLEEKGIPYASSWESGSTYDSGTRYHRFTDEGEAVQKDVYDDALNPVLSALMELLDSPQKLAEAIVEAHAKVTPLPWDTQEQNSKRFLARKLIGA